MFVIQITTNQGTAYMAQKQKNKQEQKSSITFHWDRSKALLLSKDQADDASQILSKRYPKAKIKIIALASLES